MRIDYRIFDGSRGGLSFGFVPSMHALDGHYDYHGSDVFNIWAEPFLFIERMVARAFPDWSKGYFFGVCAPPKETWLEILAQFPGLRWDVRHNMPWDAILSKYVGSPAWMPQRHKFHRKALLNFLNQFEARVRGVLERYPHLAIRGI